MAGNNYYMNYDPRWPSFHEEIYGTAHDHNRWNDFRSPPVYGPVEEPRNFGYEGSQYWRPHNYNGGYDGPLVPVGEVFAGPGPGTPLWMQGNYYSPHHHHRKDDMDRPWRITVEMWVPMCCDKCERRVREHLEDMEGAEVVTTDQWTRRVTVTGDVRPEFALCRVQRVKPNSTFWCMRPCN